METTQVPELKELFDGDHRNIILDLRDLRLANRDAEAMPWLKIDL
jgi:hypothetical protein